MDLIISGRGIVLGRDFKDAVTRKVARVGRLVPALSEARATFTAEKFRRTVRLTLTARHQVFSTTATDADLPVRRARFVRKVLESEVGRRG